MSGGKPSAGMGVKMLVELALASTFELVFYFVRCDVVTVSPNQINICIILLLLLSCIVVCLSLWSRPEMIFLQSVWKIDLLVTLYVCSCQLDFFRCRECNLFRSRCFDVSRCVMYCFLFGKPHFYCNYLHFQYSGLNSQHTMKMQIE